MAIPSISLASGLYEANNASQLHDFLFGKQQSSAEKKKQAASGNDIKLKFQINNCGGRYITFIDSPSKLESSDKLHYKDIINRMYYIFENCCPSMDPGLNEGYEKDAFLGKKILKSLKELDKDGNDQLAKCNILTRILTYICQFFGNMLFDRDGKIKEIERLLNQKISGDQVVEKEEKGGGGGGASVQNGNDYSRMPLAELLQRNTKTTRNVINERCKSLVPAKLKNLITSMNTTEGRERFADILLKSKHHSLGDIIEILNQIKQENQRPHVDFNFEQYICDAIRKKLMNSDDLDLYNEEELGKASPRDDLNNLVQITVSWADLNRGSLDLTDQTKKLIAHHVMTALEEHAKENTNLGITFASDRITESNIPRAQTIFATVLTNLKYLANLRSLNLGVDNIANRFPGHDDVIALVKKMVEKQKNLIQFDANLGSAEAGLKKQVKERRTAALAVFLKENSAAVPASAAAPASSVAPALPLAPVPAAATAAVPAVPAVSAVPVATPAPAGAGGGAPAAAAVVVASSS